MVPGDFFYFTKILLEKIQLALTFDDIKEARLIAEYAAERLAEAEVLFAEGDEEAALDTITAAIEYMENTDDVVEEPPVEEPVEEQTDLIDVELDVEVIDNDDVSPIEEPAVEVEDGIDALVSQNIIALTAAMEKVKNPKAKAALQRNIDKSYTKLAKKLEKQIKKEEKQLKKEEEVTSKESPVQVVEQELGTDDINDGVENSPDTPTKHEQREALKIEKKNSQKVEKQQRQEAKVQVMEEKKQYKEKKKEEKGNNENNGKGNKGNNGNNGKGN
ncbi:MAG: hypothetical protein K0Q87_5387 [Neobacillus sp.]|nr:hypothetical protein [Neobacillus sp.]